MDNTSMSACSVCEQSLCSHGFGMTDLCLAGIKTHFGQLLHCLLLTGTEAPGSLPVLGPCPLVTPLGVLLGSLQGPVTSIGTGWVVALTAGDCLVPAACSHHNIASKLSQICHVHMSPKLHSLSILHMQTGCGNCGALHTIKLALSSQALCVATAAAAANGCKVVCIRSHQTTGVSKVFAAAYWDNSFPIGKTAATTKQCQEQL